MPEAKPHRTAVLKLVHDEREAAPFLFGYLLADIPDSTLCNALAAWRRHVEELEQLEELGELEEVDELMRQEP
jgi:hypothetical protein